MTEVHDKYNTGELEAENITPEQPPEENDSRVFIGFHPFGGIRLDATDVRLDAQEAFILAGQLTAHATLMINQGYMEQAMAQKMAQEKGIIIPGK